MHNLESVLENKMHKFLKDFNGWFGLVWFVGFYGISTL